MQDDPTPTTWQDYFDLRRALRALGDEVRLNIVRTLASGDQVKVTDLAATLVISQPLVSWHLGALRRSGLVKTRRKGREVYITLDLARYRAIVRQLGSLIEPPEPLDSLDSLTSLESLEPSRAPRAPLEPPQPRLTTERR